jgi:polysaccharide deacetylase family protein (PEP-CTERM system associated)
MQITFTVDLEDPTEEYAPDGRYVLMTQRILDLCDAVNCKATFFVVGRAAEAAPQLIRDVAARGHEIAYHSHNHISLTEEDPARFCREMRRDKKLLERLSGKTVLGFRAPRFSLTPESRWALDVLAEQGFRYSSSIMPTSISRFGFPEAKKTAFVWPNGIVEFPLPVASLGKFRLPYLGGIYLYQMPLVLVRGFLSRSKPGDVLWTYAHPYDFDQEEEFVQMPRTPLWVSLVLWQARRRAASKIRSILEWETGKPLGERLSEVV